MLGPKPMKNNEDDDDNDDDDDDGKSVLKRAVKNVVKLKAYIYS